MVRGRKPKVAKLGAVSNSVGNTLSLTNAVNNGHHVGRPVTRSVKEKAEKNLKASIRRSERRKSFVSSIPTDEVITEKIDIEEREKQELCVEKANSQPGTGPQGLEEKIYFLVQSVQAFKSKVTKRPFVSGDQAGELNYKTLYLESQKMVEALTKENHQLAKSLESALAKVEVYEKMRDAFGSMKDMVLVSNLTRITDALVNFTSQVTSGKFAIPAVAAERNVSLLQATNGQSTTPAVAAELPDASLPQATSDQGTTLSIVAVPSASLLQPTTGQGTFSVEPDAHLSKRSKRGRKKKEWL